MKAQRALSDEEERVRLDGLRILARHALAHPERYGGLAASPVNGHLHASEERAPSNDAA